MPLRVPTTSSCVRALLPTPTGQPIRQPSSEAKMIFLEKNRGSYTRIETCGRVDEQHIIVSSRKVNNPKTEVRESLFDALDPDTTLWIDELVELDGELPNTLHQSCRHMFEDIQLRTFDVHFYQIDAGVGRHLRNQVLQRHGLHLNSPFARTIRIRKVRGFRIVHYQEGARAARAGDGHL